MKLPNNEKITITPIFLGGLGNILYQIANTLSVAKDYKATPIFYKQCSNDLKDYQPFGGHSFSKVNGLPQTLYELFPRLTFFDKPLLAHQVRQMGQMIEEKNVLEFDKLPPPKSDTVLNGYFFSHKYFSHNLPYILEYLEPAETVNNYVNKKYGDLFHQRTVSLHLRMGNEGDNFHVSDIPVEWYHRLLRKFRRKTRFVVCSDNIVKARAFLEPFVGRYDFFFVENEPMYIDLMVMSRCQKHILHNSTLSAWVAILNRKRHKKVYYHDPLFAELHGVTAIFPDWKDPEKLRKYWRRNIDFWKKKYSMFVAYVFRKLREIKRNFLHKLFGVYYILDHEKDNFKEKK